VEDDLRKRWIAALRSGQYKQGRERLRRADNTFCCLGVLSDVADSSKWHRPEGCGYYIYGEFNGGIPPREILQRAGIDPGYGRLIEMNDSNSKTFAEIADYLESREGV
jgi:hypothetical protein